MRASYTYLSSTFENPAGSDIREVRRPKSAASLSGNYAWDKFSLNVALNYNGDQKDDYFPPFPPFQERVDLESYTLLNLSGRYRVTEQLELNLRVLNAFDEEYEEVYGFSSPGVAGYLGLKYRF